MKRKTSGAGDRSAGSTLAAQPAFEALVEETVALFHRFTAAAQDLHGQGELTAGKRGVLRGLDRSGPQTVPQMARVRPVSRQYIQTLVNLLAKDGYVEFIANPAHKRSQLVRLTPKGKQLLEAMYRREASVLSHVEVPVKEADLEAAVAVLRRVRSVFEGERWRPALIRRKEPS